MTAGARWAALTLAAITAIVHFAVAGQYDVFRNELYFIVCGRHPAFGYADQPPFVPLLSALMTIGGVNVWLLRLPAVLSAIAIIPLTVMLAQLFGASTRGAWLAAVASACAPLVMGISAYLGTSTFEPAEFTGLTYLIARAHLRDEPRMYWWAGALGGIAFETRYGVLIWGAAIAIGIALCGPRSILRNRDVWIGVAIAAIIALPNVIWQAVHGLPFLELVRNDRSGNLIRGPIAYALGQIFLVNVVLAPLWIAGIIAPFTTERLAPFRWVAVAFLATLAIVFATHGKAYYTVGAYPTIFALGAAAATLLPRLLVGAWSVLAFANNVLALPYYLPVLPPAKMKAMLESFHPRPMERAGIGAPLMQTQSDEFGWRALARDVEAIYDALPPSERAKAAIFGSNYGEAAAVDVYGRNLPPAISGNGQYYLWGTRGYDGSVVIAINADPAEWATFCDSARVVAHFGTSPYAMPYETDRPIVLCLGMHPPLAQLWPRFKYYGIENLGTLAGR